ncbi:MAG: PsbP-related protein [Candidatus Magasanikbacteria bacterium]
MVKKILLALVVIILLALLGFGFLIFKAGKDFKNEVETTVNDLNAQNKVEQTTTPETNKEEPVTMKTYTNDNAGITMSYPNNWDVEEGESNNSLIVSFFSKKQSDKDDFLENVNVLFQDFGDIGIDLDTLHKESIKELTKNIPDFKLTKEEDMTIDGEPGKLIIYTGTYPGTNFVGAVVQAYTVWDDYAYIITYVGKQGDFEKFVPTVQEMLKSFSF